MRPFTAPSGFALAALLVLLPVMVLLSRDFGVTYDERFQQKYGEELWEYVHGRRPRAAFDTDFAHQNLYGGTFELAAVAAQHAFPRANAYVVRHAVNAFFGWLTVVFTWLIARKLFGEAAGALAAVLLLLLPRFLGHSMNNPKDIPFAAFATAATYFLVTLQSSPPSMTWAHAVKLAVAIGLAVSVRPVGLLFGAYLAAAAAWLALAQVRTSPRAVLRLGTQLAAVAVISLTIGVSCWPWAQASPLWRPIQAFFELSRFDYGGSVLFAGDWIDASALPRSYVPTWLWLALPPIVIAGMGLSTLYLGKPERRPVLFLWILGTLPLVGAILRGSTLYDGLRHFLFLAPIAIALAAAGWIVTLRIRVTAVRLIAVVLLAIGLGEPLVFELRNHPNEVAYFSPLTGGPRGAFGRYDMDYWGNCVLEASRWAAARATEAGLPIAVSGAPEHLVYLNAERFGSLHFTKPQVNVHHFGIYLLRGPGETVLEFAARSDVVHRVQTADGAPLCVVLAGPLYPEVRDRLPKVSR